MFRKCLRKNHSVIQEKEKGEQYLGLLILFC